jgi:hypothetical protein
LHYDGFRTWALAEQTIRIEAATAARLVHEAAKRASEVAMQARMALAREQVEKDRVARESDQSPSIDRRARHAIRWQHAENDV